MSTQTWQESVDEIWKLFRETSAQMKQHSAETTARFKETREQFKEIAQQSKETREQFKEIAQQSKETREQFKEIAQQSKETREQFKEIAQQSKETREQFKEIAQQFKETDKKINKVHGLFTSQWGKMIEAMVKPNALKLFQDRGIDVYNTHQRVEGKHGGRAMELDLLLENSDVVVAIEVKSTLRVSDVQYFLERLEQFLYFFPRYRGCQIYGGVAGMNIVEGVDRYAYRRGLFVLQAVGDGISCIKNDKTFTPTDFSKKQQD